MTTELITKSIWSRLTSESKKCRSKSVVAVAYFSKGAASMLPLLKGSILLVDASEKAVKSGQTCPAELLKLYYKGVKIYSKDWLHAKMFVFGNSLYIGSTNASSNSTKLTEAIIKTSEKKSVADAKEFIKSYCKVELGDDQLSRLQKIYKEPRFAGLGGGSKKKTKQHFINSNSFFIYHLELDEFTPDEQEQSQKGKKEAEAKRIKKSRHLVDEFKWENNFPAKKGDIIMQVIDEGNNSYVSPPGIVIHQRRWKHKNQNKTLTYVEIPTKKRKNLKFVKSQLASNEKKLLMRNGVRNNLFAEKLNSLWL